MIKNVTLLISLILSSFLYSQTHKRVHMSHGGTYEIPISNIDSITYTILDDESSLNIITLPVELINLSAVSFYGIILSDGGSEIVSRGFCWDTSPSPDLLTSQTISSGNGIGMFSENITSLTSNSTYYVRTYATTISGTYYGDDIVFSTVAIPSVATYPLYNIKGNSARAGGVIINNGGDNIISKGLCWSTQSNPTIFDNTTTSFDETMNGLTTNTIYYVRAYATNSYGTAYGNQISFNSGKTMGTVHAGGIVFYNDGNGNGLVCAESNQSTGSQWGCYGYSIGGTSTAINTGMTNTNAIIARCSSNGIAARNASDLILNGFDDWFLPSKEELNLMYQNLKIHNLGGNWGDNYWSSSEYNENPSENACVQSFNDGSQGNTSKNMSFHVRAVRAFLQ